MPHNEQREVPFKVLRLPMGAYQFATFVHRPEPDALEPYWEEPVYTVEFEAAIREPFTREKCLMLIDPQRAEKLAVALHAIGSGVPRRLHALERLMADEPYGAFRR
jgi:hypothetical protein